MRRALIGGYLFVVHALLGVAVVKTDLVARIAAKVGLGGGWTGEEEAMIVRMREVQARMDPAVPAGATIFLGDSLTVGLVTAALAPYTVNYGIGGQRSDQLIESMDIYESMGRAGRVVITIGTNDLLQGQEAGIEGRYRAMLSKIPGGTAVVMNSVPPLGDVVVAGRRIDDADVRKVVVCARAVCEADRRCRFVDSHEALTTSGGPKPGVLLGDHIHLSPMGYRLWIQAMRPAFGGQAAR